MARSITRVELHYADWTDYERLHLAMEGEGFSRSIVDDNTKERFKLPTAEYYKERDGLTKQEVLDSAIKAAEQTGKTYSILVTMSAGITFTNLEKIG